MSNKNVRLTAAQRLAERRMSDFSMSVIGKIVRDSARDRREIVRDRREIVRDSARVR